MKNKKPTTSSSGAGSLLPDAHPHDNLPEVEIWTDGSCYPNPGPGGWAAVLVHELEDGETRRRELSGPCVIETTNNRMELEAAIRGLSALRDKCFVQLYSDSAYVVNMMAKGMPEKWAERDWKTSSKSDVKNKDLWKRLQEVASRHLVTFNHVRGHAGNGLNPIADELCGREREMITNDYHARQKHFELAAEVDRLNEKEQSPDVPEPKEGDAGEDLLEDAVTFTAAVANHDRSPQAKSLRLQRRLLRKYPDAVMLWLYFSAGYIPEVSERPLP